MFSLFHFLLAILPFRDIDNSFLISFQCKRCTFDLLKFSEENVLIVLCGRFKWLLFGQLQSSKGIDQWNVCFPQKNYRFLMIIEYRNPKCIESSLLNHFPLSVCYANNALVFNIMPEKWLIEKSEIVRLEWSRYNVKENTLFRVWKGFFDHDFPHKREKNQRIRKNNFNSIINNLLFGNTWAFVESVRKLCCIICHFRVLLHVCHRIIVAIIYSTS